MRNKVLVGGIVAAVLAAAAGWLFFDPHYYAASEVDRKPYPMRRVDLDFPPVIDGVEYYGKLTLDVYIGSDGSVHRVDVVSANVPARFRDAALKALEATTWEPARKGWRRVKSVKRYELYFEPPSRSLERSLTAPAQ